MKKFIDSQDLMTKDLYVKSDDNDNELRFYVLKGLKRKKFMNCFNI